MIDRLKSNAFAWNSLVLFSGSMITNILNYIFHLAAGRMVTPAAYGEIESLISLMSIVSVPAMALVMVVTKLSAGHKADGDTGKSRMLFSYLMRKVSTGGLAVFLVLAAASPFLAKHLNIDSVWSLVLVWLAMLLSFYYSVNIGLLNGWQRFKQSSLAVAIGTAAKLVVGLALIAVGYQVGGAVASFVVAGVVVYFAAAWYLKFIWGTGSGDGKELNLFANQSLKKLLLTFFLGNLAISILGNADMILAKRNLEDLAAGQYGALNIVGKIIFFATGVIATVAFSMASENTHQQRSSRQLIIKAGALIAVIGSLATGFYFLFPKFVLGLLFGSKYFAVAGFLGWYAAAVALYSVNNLLIQYYLTLGKIRMLGIALAVSLAMIGGILLYGRSISAIINIVIIAQLVALAAGLVFFYQHPVADEKE